MFAGVRFSIPAALTALSLLIGNSAPGHAIALKPAEIVVAIGVETAGHRHGHHRHGGRHWDRGWHGGFGPGWGLYDDWDGPWRRPRIGVTIVIPIHPGYAPAYPRFRASRGVVIHGNTHANWCLARYRSYHVWDNSFQPFHGPRRACISPYR